MAQSAEWFRILVLLFAGVASAQTPKLTAPHNLSEALDTWITNTEMHLVPVAEAMPEDKYSFAPTAGEFKGARTFAEQLKHLAANNYAMSALMTGEKPTRDQQQETGPDSVQTKAEIVAYLKGSFAALHHAVSMVDERNVIETIKTPSAWQTTRLQLTVDAVAHSFDHYGQLVEYLRMNGIVPPGSRPAK